VSKTKKVKYPCPLCGHEDEACSWGADLFGSFLHCLNPVCGPNAEKGKVGEWYVTNAADAKKILELLFAEGEEK
jgi:hypothetical protein